MTRTKPYLFAAVAAAIAATIATLLWLVPRPGEPAPTLHASAQSRTTVTDLLGRKVELALPVRRMMLGEGRQLYLLAALDTEDPIGRIVG